MRVRPAGINDLPEVQRIEDACFLEERYPPDVLREMLTDRDFHTYLAEEEGEVLGSATVAHRRGKPFAQLVSIAVLPEHRGRGAAKALLEAMEGKAREEGAKRMTLQVNVLNVAALNLYLRHGYVIQGVLGDYYGPCKDAYYMDKGL